MSEKWAQFEDPVEAKGYTQIANVVMRNPNLSMQAKYLYGLLKSYAWEDPDCHPGIKRLCRDAGVSKDTLAKYMHELRQAKLIEVKRRGRGMTNLYIFKRLARILEGDTGSHQDGDTGSVLEGDTGSHNEDSVNEDSVNNPTGGEADASILVKENNLTPQQKLASEFYERLKSRYGIELEPGKYGYHIDKFRRMLDKYKPDELETHKVLKHMVEKYPAAPKIDAVSAMEDVKLGRDTGEAWNKPAPWEKPPLERQTANTHYANYRDWTGGARH